jgi:UDP:flavonoid glycosyltransferase YjiC (YdhE family)
MSLPKPSPDKVAVPAKQARVLFVVEAVTLAHPARSGVLAAALSQLPEVEVFFACDDRYDFCLPTTGMTHLPLNSISTAEFLDALATGRTVYREQQLLSYIEQDMALIARVKPDLIVGDFRVSLAVSAPKSGVPLLNLTNAHWSDYSLTQHCPVPELPITQRFGVKLAQWLFDRVRPLVFHWQARPLNRLRKKFGMSTLRGLRGVYTFGNFVAYLDLPSLEPMASLPPTHRFIGPVWWSPKLTPDPALWDFLQHKPLIYITLGSSGAVDLLPIILDIVGAMPVFALVATAGRTATLRPGKRIKIVDYADGDLVAQHASAMICNGGNATLNQALAAGVPVLGIPNNLDQFLTMAGITQAGAGITLRGSEVVTKLQDSLSALLHEPGYARQARRLQQEMKSFDSAALFVDFVQDILSKRLTRL